MSFRPKTQSKSMNLTMAEVKGMLEAKAEQQKKQDTMSEEDMARELMKRGYKVDK